MKKTIRIIVANPSGNITIFVLDKIDKRHYQTVASQLLAMKEYKAEQVGFVVNENTMNMSGMEFCGNAARSFALLSAKVGGVSGPGNVTVNISGVKEPLQVQVNTLTNYTKIKMPMPQSIRLLGGTGNPLLDEKVVINFGGIAHLIARNVEPTLENFNVYKDYVEEIMSPPATGVMFYDTETNKMTPVVYVKDVDTVYFEGSCGSGTTALAISEFLEMKDKFMGEKSIEIVQPAGSITATLSINGNELKGVYIEGSVPYSRPIEVEVEI